MTILKVTKVVILLSWIPICIIYYKNNINVGYPYASGSIVRNNHTVVKKFDTIYKGAETYLINTPRCQIPNYMKSLKFKEVTIPHQSCGVRAVFVKRLDNNYIEFNIDKSKMEVYSHGRTYYCCARFGAPQNISGKIYLTKLKYSSCTTFQNRSRIQLDQEIVTISCYSKSASIYEDAYVIIKNLVTNLTSQEQNTFKKNSWNILILGMDTMSSARLMSSMPLTAQYLRKSNWLDFPGYHKVGYNTFPNVMSLLTGKNVSTINKACSKGLDKCSKYLLWNRFKEAGYTTAYGEEFLQLPDTFSKFDGFHVPPTDHYMRPFFLTGETIIGNYVCTKKMTSAYHILDYAYQFSDVYKTQKYYGFFWINSCSHNVNNNPALFDVEFRTFFERMDNNGVMDDTFILFLSDHGIRFGSMRVPMESYYEERLPMLYLWVPKRFRVIYPEKYMNLQLNQNRLITPYDLYLTMVGILKINQESNEVTTSEACPLCKSLFAEVSANRTCSDAAIDEKWCSCHNMVTVVKNNRDVIQSVQVIMEQLNKRTTNTKTESCTECYKFSIKSILRSHSYEDTVQNKTLYVIAFVVDPGNIGYEAIVQKHDEQFSLIPFMDTITGYNARGRCVINSNDRGFCICKETCKKKVVKKKKKV